MLPLYLVMNSMFLMAQIGTNFEEPFGGAVDYVDLSSPSIAHVLVNNPNPQPTVNYTNTGGELGFTTTFTPSRIGTPGTTGLSDGDAVGVLDNASVISSTDVTSWSSGNAYIVEDSDGMITLEFDEISLIGTVNPRFQMDMWIDDSSYETGNGGNDRVYIRLEINGGTTVINVFDSDGGGSGGGAGGDLDAALYNGILVEGNISNIDVDLNAYVGSAVKLIIEADFDAASEKVIFDNILFTEGRYNSTLSSANYKFEDTVSLYPNPSSDFIGVSNLKLTKKYTILNMIGQVVKQGVISNQEKIYIGDFSNGLYVLKFDRKNAIKFMKK